MTASDHLVRKLNDLIELDHDAIEAYEAAIERLESPAYKTQLREYCNDHERHVRDLTDRVRQLGGKPAEGPDMMKILTKGKVVIADLIGQDRAILMAMRANEEVTNKRYEVALEMDDLDAQTRTLLQTNLGDERRHRAWIEAQLEAEKDARDAT